MILVRRRALAVSGASWVAGVRGIFSTMRKRKLLSFVSNLGEGQSPKGRGIFTQFFVIQSGNSSAPLLIVFVLFALVNLISLVRVRVDATDRIWHSLLYPRASVTSSLGPPELTNN